MAIISRGRGATAPQLLVTRVLGSIDRMAEAMWQDDAARATGKPRRIKWTEENPEEREKWTRRATAATLALFDGE